MLSQTVQTIRSKIKKVLTNAELSVEEVDRVELFGENLHLASDLELEYIETELDIALSC